MSAYNKCVFTKVGYEGINGLLPQYRFGDDFISQRFYVY